MDRYDESRHVNDTDETSASSGSGDVLGLGGSVVPKMPGDPSASSDPASVRRRRERAREDAEPLSQEDPDRQRSGATGIDMGAGGQGTHLSGK
jgi:hypothetical protein